jgi:hypothetical protein
MPSQLARLSAHLLVVAVLSPATFSFAEGVRAEAVPVSPGEISRVTVCDGEHQTTFIEVVPTTPVKQHAAQPILPAPPAPPLPSDAELREELKQAAKSFQSLSLQAIIYPANGIAPLCTVLIWQGESGRKWRAVSNVDFRLLEQIGQFETEDAVYEWFLLVEVAGAGDATRPVVNLAATPARFRVDASAADLAAAPADFEALNHLHRYVDTHREALIAAYAVALAREAESDRRERELREHPLKKPDTVIRFSTSESLSRTQP